jgi:hypothetical protein
VGQAERQLLERPLVARQTLPLTEVSEVGQEERQLVAGQLVARQILIRQLSGIYMYVFAAARRYIYIYVFAAALRYIYIYIYVNIYV